MNCKKVHTNLSGVRSYIGFILLLAVEGVMLYKRWESSLEMFFMIWGFVFLALIINNSLSRTDRPMLVGFGGNDATRAAYQAALVSEKDLNPKKELKNNPIVLFSVYNILYGLALIANVIGYVLVMPK